MGGWGTTLYPRGDESMRFRNGMARKIRLERCQKGAQGLGAEDRGRTTMRRPSPPRERTVPARGQRGARGSLQGRGGHPASIRMPHNPFRVQGRPNRGAHGPSFVIFPAELLLHIVYISNILFGLKVIRSTHLQ